MKALMGFGLLLSTLSALQFVEADERPPADGKSLYDVVETLGKSGYDPIVEISFDDGVWEAEGYKGDTAFEVTLDAKTGAIVHEHRDDGDPKPPADSMSLAKLIVTLQNAGYENLNDVSFERQSWEIEAARDDQKRELRVDAKDGRVISDRVDD